MKANGNFGPDAVRFRDALAQPRAGHPFEHRADILHVGGERLHPMQLDRSRDLPIGRHDRLAEVQILQQPVYDRPAQERAQSRPSGLPTGWRVRARELQRPLEKER